MEKAKKPFTIVLDREDVDRKVEAIESDRVFQTIRKAKLLDLSDIQRRIVIEVTRLGRSTVDQIATATGAPVNQRDIDALVHQAYLVADRVGGTTFYRVAVPPPPRQALQSRQLAKEVHRRLQAEGKRSPLTSYVHELGQLGPAGLDIIRKVMSDKADEYARALKDVAGKGPVEVGLRFLALMEEGGVPIEFVEVLEDRVRFRVLRCAYNLGAGSYDLCEAVSEFDYRLTQNLGCRVVYSSRLSRGDKYCEGLITVRPRDGGAASTGQGGE